MKSKGDHLVMTEFGYLTPISRYEICAQIFWPVRPLKVELNPRSGDFGELGGRLRLLALFSFLSGARSAIV